MKIDYNKIHIETEKNFYKKMNKRKSFLLSLAIIGIGCIFLCIRCWQIGVSGTIQELIWVISVAVLFVILTFIGYFVFEYERKKYTEK
jgi:uncharacterized Tic20 family protein